jgi:hypothetical protein
VVVVVDVDVDVVRILNGITVTADHVNDYVNG